MLSKYKAWRATSVATDKNKGDLNMSKFRDIAAVGAVSTVRIVLQIVGWIMSFMPVIMFGLPWWAGALIFVAVEVLDTFLMNVPGIIMWIVALVITVLGKQDALAVAYYICFGLYTLRFIACLILAKNSN